MAAPGGAVGVEAAVGGAATDRGIADAGVEDADANPVDVSIGVTDNQVVQGDFSRRKGVANQVN